ncbi:MAG: hypothetical protein JSW73_04505 [Candidatus Woesearchaeota archaeon]|nr:MAG: hypothetical protein JSW73_04505 [Candidatus Woesearchaeota archaeon]
MKHMSIDEIVDIESKETTIAMKLKEGRTLRVTEVLAIEETKLSELKKGDTIMYRLEDLKLKELYKLDKIYDEINPIKK